MASNSVHFLDYKPRVSPAPSSTNQNKADIGHQISAMMLRFEQLLGITANCECCSQKYREKNASSRVNEPIAENTEFEFKYETKDTNT
jgi:hypothetical protein